MRCLYCHNPDTWDYGGKEYTAEEVAALALKYKSYIANGGVTVTGGEPLLQIEFVTELFRILKEKGVHTALDTSGITYNVSDSRFRTLIRYTDLVLLDIKHIDDGVHRKLTGHGNEKPLAFARFLSDSGVDMWIRHVLLDGYTDNDAYLLKLKQFISSLKTVKKVEVLPYHTMGEEKYKKLGIAYPLAGVKPPERERVQNARRILKID